MNKTIKLEDIWVSNTNSTTGVVFKTKGFKTQFKKDRYYDATECWLYYDKNNELTHLPTYEEDVKVFSNEDDAYKHQNKRKQYWLDYYKKQAKEYADKVDAYEKSFK